MAHGQLTEEQIRTEEMEKVRRYLGELAFAWCYELASDLNIPRDRVQDALTALSARGSVYLMSVAGGMLARINHGP